MTLQQISQQVRDLIIQGELDDAANTLVQFLDKEWMSRADKAQVQLYNQALYQLSQLNELKHQVFAGIISNEEADLKRNRIRAVLLEISEELKGIETRPVVMAQSGGTAPNVVSSKKDSRLWVWGILALVAVSIISLLVYRQINPATIPETKTIIQKDTVLVPGKSETADQSTTEQKTSGSQPKTQDTRPKNTSGSATPPPSVGKPDLSVSFTVEPATVKLGQPARVTITAFNSGHKAAKNVEVYWLAIKNSPPKVLIFDHLPAGGSASQSFDFTWPDTQGYISAKATIDPLEQIPEENEANNIQYKSLPVSTNSQTSGTASNTEKTELVVNIKAPSRIKMGQKVTIEVIAINKSRTIAADNFEVWWWANETDSTPFRKFKVDHLEPQKSKSFSFEFSWMNILETTPVALAAEVDPLKTVSEVLENNNKGRQVVVVEK